MSTDRHALFLLGALALAGCHKDEPSLPTDVQAAVSEQVPTVITVTWRTEEPTVGHVAFGLDGALDRATPEEAEPTTEHRAVLVGLPAEREVSWQVVSDGIAGESNTTTTGSLPPDLVPPTVTGDGNDLFLTTTLVGDSNVAVLLDPDGNITWWHRDQRGLSVFRALATRDGQGVVYSSAIQNGGPSPDSAFVRVPWDGSSEEEIPVPDLAHDFVELPDGTLVSLVYETRDEVLGSGLVSVDPDGTATPLWSAWDCLDPVANPGDDPEHGWTHANALDYDPVEDAFLVGLRSLNTILHVDRQTGDCAWGFGGSGGTVDVDGARFVHQHQFERTDGGLLVFDNDGAPGMVSRVVEYAFDGGATASEVRTLSADPPLYSFIMGDVHRTADGDTLAVYSVPGVIDRMGPDGAQKWRLQLPEGVLLGFFQPLADPYRVP